MKIWAVIAGRVKRLSEIDSHGRRWISAPAKVNLMLSVHGKREDDFHSLTSIVAPVAFGDRLGLRPLHGAESRLICEHPEVPVDPSNLVLRASEVFSGRLGVPDCFDFLLEKKIPVGAGLGGGSSDGAAALVALNDYFQRPFGDEELRELAALLGSDCALFIDPRPALMEGRGERIQPLEADLADRISGQRVFLFRPPFPVNTAWAYRALASTPGAYEDEERAKERLREFYSSGQLETLLFNSFEKVVGSKYLAIPCALEVVRRLGARAIMSGSGSACFAMLNEEVDAGRLREECLKSLGSDIFCVETSFL